MLKNAFNTLSISISQFEDPERAVEALQLAGNGTAEMAGLDATKLPKGFWLWSSLQHG